jgi:hypothetical protein
MFHLKKIQLQEIALINVLCGKYVDQLIFINHE